MLKRTRKIEESEADSLVVHPKKRIRTAEGWKREQLKGEKKEEGRSVRKTA